MDEWISKYQGIIEELVKKDFPKLKGKRIFIKEKKASWRAHVVYSPRGFYLYVSDKLKRLPDKTIKRVIFHELCHLEIFNKWGVIKTNLDFIWYSLSKKHRKESEAEANILMIKKGKGKEVLDARRENLRRGLSFSLSEKEIKDHISELDKKWH